MTSPNNSTPRPRLERELGECLSSDLQAHIKRGVVIVVSDKLDLLDVAEAVAKDEKAQVEEWLNNGALTPPTPAQIERWAKEVDTRFASVIVAPYVLIQPLSL